MTQEYEIEPFMPGISPIGKVTSPITEASTPRPYIPDGTGYNMLRFKPGYKRLKNSLEGLGRVSYKNTWTDSGLERLFKIDKPPANFLANLNTPETRSAGIQKFDNEIRGHKSYGWYDPGLDTIVVKDDVNKPRITRHEVAHALQDRKGVNIARPSTYTVTGEELDARIVEHKGIRKGMKDWARDVAPHYAKGYVERELPGQGKAREVVAKGIGKAAELIPNTPGTLKFRAPTGLGANIIDMFSLPPLNYSMPHETHDIFGQPLDQGAGFEPEMIPSHNEYDYEIEPLEYPDQGGTLPMTYGPKMIPNPRAGQAINPYGVI